MVDFPADENHEVGEFAATGIQTTLAGAAGLCQVARMRNGWLDKSWTRLQRGWWAGVALSILGGGVSLLGLAGGQWWMLDLCNHFQAQYLVFQVLCLLGLLVLRRWRWALVPAVFLLVPGWYLAPYYLPCATTTQPTHPLRVLSFNVLNTNTRYADTVRWVQASNPDIAFFPEVSHSWVAGLAPLKATLPHTIMHAQTDNFGFAVFSKYPIVAQDLIPSVILGVAMVQVTLEIDGRRVLFVGVHPASPLSASYTHGRDAALKDLAERLRHEPLPVIVAGDFNATPWSQAMRPLFEAGLHDTRWGRGFSATWRRDLVLVAIPIDHILTDPRITTQTRWTGPYLGSDHRGVVADLRW
ncbi:MAG: endonuclease/exonuclease/phosphatase family protein [Verrucomicrobiota bacterium]